MNKMLCLMCCAVFATKNELAAGFNTSASVSAVVESSRMGFGTVVGLSLGAVATGMYAAYKYDLHMLEKVKTASGEYLQKMEKSDEYGIELHYQEMLIRYCPKMLGVAYPAVLNTTPFVNSRHLSCFYKFFENTVFRGIEQRYTRGSMRSYHARNFLDNPLTKPLLCAEAFGELCRVRFAPILAGYIAKILSHDLRYSILHGKTEVTVLFGKLSELVYDDVKDEYVGVDFIRRRDDGSCIMPENMMKVFKEVGLLDYCTIKAGIVNFN